MKIPTVALVGRPNVGKSTIFNKLVGEKISIIEDTPGVTRDRIYSEASYKDYIFNLIDTGGIDGSLEKFNDVIKMQAEIAIDESDLVLFVVDGKEGLTSNDFLVRDMLRNSGKKVIVVINKVDNKKSEEHIYDFYELGFDTYIPVSGEHGLGFFELRDAIVSNFQKKEYYTEDKRLKFAVIGRPNVVKSSLINAMLNEDRVIVSDVAGTTRDAIDSEFENEFGKYVFIDTAGIRRKSKVEEQIEKYSVMRSILAVERADVCLIMIDANERCYRTR